MEEGFPGGSIVKKKSACNADEIQSLGREDPLGKETANPLQYSCLGNPMDREVWWAIFHGITRTQTQLNN